MKNSCERSMIYFLAFLKGQVSFTIVALNFTIKKNNNNLLDFKLWDNRDHGIRIRVLL